MKELVVHEEPHAECRAEIRALREEVANLQKANGEVALQWAEEVDRAEALRTRCEELENSIVELWHESEAGQKDLPHYLRMTAEEYSAWAVHGTALAPLPTGED